MPQKGQVSVTIPTRIYEQAEKYFKEHEEELMREDICSVTGLIRRWVLKAATSDRKTLPAE